MNSMQITPIFDTRKLEILNKIKATQTENLINVIELVVNDNQFSGYQIAINFTDSQKRPIGAPHIFTFGYIEGQDTISFLIPSGLTQFQSVYFQIVAIYETKVWKSEVVKLYFNETLAETDGEISQDPMYSQWIFAINEAIAATEAAIEATNTANLLIGSFSNFAEYSPTLEYALYNRVYFKGSTYEYVNNTPTTGIAPIEKQSSEYWQLIASGSYINEINTTVVGPDTNPMVVRGTNDQNVILDFSLPRAPTVELDVIPVVEKLPNQSPTVEDINPTGDMVLQFGLPRAPSVTSTIGTQLNANQDPLLTIGGTNGDVTLEFQLPKTRLVSDETTVLNPNQNPVASVIESEVGDLNFKFDLPRVPEVFVANVDVVTSDQSPNVVNSPDLEGDSGLYFTIPRAPAVTVGSTTTLTPTSPATVTPTYTNGDVSLAFGVPKGDKGDTGEPFHVRGSFDTLLDLESSIYHPGAEGDAWAIGTTSPMDIYIWNIAISGWVNIGPLVPSTNAENILVEDTADIFTGVNAETVLKELYDTKVPNSIVSTSDVVSTIVKRKDVAGNRAIEVNAIDISTGLTAPNPTTRQVSWNQEYSTYNFELLNGVTLQAGQETHLYGMAIGAISAGQVVMFSPTNNGVYKFKVANASEIGFSPKLIAGIATSDALDGEYIYVTNFGVVHNLDTSAFNVGEHIYYDLGASGGLTNVTPVAPNPRVVVAVVAVKSNIGVYNGKLFVNIIIQPSLNDINDVYTSSNVDGDLLSWNDTNSRWQNISKDTYTYSTDFLNHENSNKLHNNFAISTGTNDYVVTLDPAPTSYEAGMIVSFLAQNANTYHSTLNCNGLGAKTIFKNVYQNLVAGDISENQIVSVIYDGTNFQVVSGSGGSGGSGVFIPYKNRVITDSETNTVTIGIADYEATRDTIFTYQNSTYISKDLDYTVSSDSLTIVKISGTWATGTVFDFHVLALSNPQTNPIVAMRHDSSFTAIENGTTICSFNYQNFYPALDSLFVYYQNLLLFEGVDYVINQNNLGITLASFSLNIGEKLNFVFLKNVIKEVNTAGSGQMLGTLATKMFSYNTQVLEETITIPSNYNASAVGPITVADGYWLNVGDGARLVIL